MSELQHKELRSLTAVQVNPNMTRRLIWGDRLMAAFIEFKAGTVVPRDRKSTRLNSSHIQKSRMPSSA